VAESGAAVDENDIALTDRHLAAAQINIYLASLWQKEEEGLSARSLELLRQSLQYDPSETKTWLTLAEYYLLKGPLSEARGILKEALTHHPDDTSLLELGVRIAVAGEAFKKAAGYAKRILEFDPINTRVRLHLQNAHISHARKQIKQKKYHLARKELDEAQLWKGAPVNATIIQILHTYLTHQDGQAGEIEQGQQENANLITLPQLLVNSGLHPAALDFLLRHESLLAGLRELALHKIFPVEDPWKKADKQGIMALLGIAGQLAKLSPETLAAPLRSLRGLLRKAARLPFTIAEGEQLCEFWVQINEDALLLEYARCLQKSWPKKPVFTYYYYYYYQGDFFEQENAIPSLENALKMAESQGDEGLSHRIAVLLDRLCRPTSKWDDDFFDEFDDEFDDDEDTEFEGIGEEKMLEEMREMADMVQTAPYKLVFQILCGLMDKKTANSLQQQLGQKGVRDLCQALLRGDDPDTIIAEMEGNPAKKKPVQGRLF
jgi:predicted TPR repeat methyltransferase